MADLIKAENDEFGDVVDQKPKPIDGKSYVINKGKEFDTFLGTTNDKTQKMDMPLSIYSF